MSCARRTVACLTLTASILGAGRTTAQEIMVAAPGVVQQAPPPPAQFPTGSTNAVFPAEWPTAAGSVASSLAVARPAPRAADVPLDALPAALRDQVRDVVEHPTFAATGPAEVFSGQLPTYQWLLDHPDRTAHGWRNLGAPCLEIVERQPGTFGWRDGRGSDVTWQAVLVTPKLRIWYAHGTVKPAALLPIMPVEAVVLLRHEEHLDTTGRRCVEHQASVFAQTDSKAAALLLKLLGPSMPRLADQALGQFGMFFSGMTTYLCRNPERAAATLAPPVVRGSTEHVARPH